MATLVLSFYHVRVFTGKTIQGLLGTDYCLILHVNRLSLLKKVFWLFLVFESELSQPASAGGWLLTTLLKSSNIKTAKHRPYIQCLGNISIAPCWPKNSQKRKTNLTLLHISRTHSILMTTDQSFMEHFVFRVLCQGI